MKVIYWIYINENMQKHYCEKCYANIDENGNGHCNWCPHYSDLLDIFKDIFPGFNKDDSLTNKKTSEKETSST